MIYHGEILKASMLRAVCDSSYFVVMDDGIYLFCSLCDY